MPPVPSTTVENDLDADTSQRPRLGSVVKRVALSLLIACVVPAALFYVCLMTTGVWSAMLAALAWAYGAIAWRALTRRRTSGLLILTAIVLTGRTIVSFVADSTYFYFLQPIISDGVVATAFLLSLAGARPMVARLAGDFYPMNHEISVRPRIRRLFRDLTLVWALVCLGKAGATLWLLQTQSMETFVLANSLTGLTLTALAAAATIVTASVVARAEGLLRPAAPALV